MGFDIKMTMTTAAYMLERRGKQEVNYLKYSNVSALPSKSKYLKYFAMSRLHFVLSRISNEIILNVY